MAPHQQMKTAVVALFLAALVVASPAAAHRPVDGYAPGAAAGTPADATPTEAAPSETSTPTPVAGGYTPGAAAGTPAEDTPTAPADSTPTEASTPAEETPTAPADSTPTEASTPAEETPADAAVSTPANAGYKDGEATPTESDVSPPPEAGTPAEATPTEAAASTPAEATPTEAAASTAADAGTPVSAGYTGADAAGTTAAAKSGKATTEDQKLMEMVNGAYKKALAAALAAAPDGKFVVFDVVFNKEIKEGLADKTESERAVFTGLVDKAFKDAYATTAASGYTTAESRFAVFVFTLTEALRAMAATLEVHAVKPATEEAVSGGGKAPAGEEQVIGIIDAAVKAAAAAAKDAPTSDKFLVFEATFNKVFKAEMGPAYDENKAVPQLNAAYKEAYMASIAAASKAKFDEFRKALIDSITAMGKAVKAAAATKPATKPATEATTEPAPETAYKPAATKPAPETATKPATKATAEPAAEAAYKPAAEATTEPAAKPAAAKTPAGAGNVGGYGTV